MQYSVLHIITTVI